MIAVASRSYWIMFMFFVISCSFWKRNAIHSLSPCYAWTLPIRIGLSASSTVATSRPSLLTMYSTMTMYSTNSSAGEVTMQQQQVMITAEKKRAAATTPASAVTTRTITSMPPRDKSNKHKTRPKKRKLQKSQNFESTLMRQHEEHKEEEFFEEEGHQRNEASHQSQHIQHLDKHLVLVLNADYQPLSNAPLSLWTWQDAIKAIFSGKVTVVDTYHPNLIIRAVNVNVPLPSVIAFRNYSPRAHFKQEKGKSNIRGPAFARKNVYLRDEYKCQYCNTMFSTHELSIDHVVPRCKGGKLCWENAVTCCRNCNGRKGQLLPSELSQVGMKLIRVPKCPTTFELGILALKLTKRRDIHPAWEPYLI